MAEWSKAPDSKLGPLPKFFSALVQCTPANKTLSRQSVAPDPNELRARKCAFSIAPSILGRTTAQHKNRILDPGYVAASRQRATPVFFVLFDRPKESDVRAHVAKWRSGLSQRQRPSGTLCMRVSHSSRA